MSAYFVCMTAGALLIFALYGLRLRAWKTALLSLAFSALLGAALARLGYALLMQELDFAYDGIEALEQLLWFSINSVSFFCGAVGVCLGVLLANRLTRRGAVIAGMDAFSPFGALLIALFRLGEIAFGSYGAGEMLAGDSPLAFFPFALKITVDGGYSYWGWAVCVLSAAFALIWAAVVLLGLRGRGRTGFIFTLSLYFLALPQVLCESLRKRGMFWLFVHVEQVLCCAVLLAVLVFWLLKSGRALPFARRWAPLLLLAVCFGLLVLTEFAIDGKLFDFSHTQCYAFLSLLVIGMGAAGVIAAKRWNGGKTA